MIEFLFECIIEFVTEKLFGVLMVIPIALIPDNKFNQKIEKRLSITVAILTALFIALLVIGILNLLTQNGNSIVNKIFISLLPIEITVSVTAYLINKFSKH